MNKKQNSIAILAVVGVIAAVVGCQSPDYPTPSPSTAGYNTTSSKAVVVNATDAAGITALFENVAAGSTLAPGANTGYVGVPLGSDQVRISGAGGTLGATGFSAKSTFLTGNAYSIFVTDSVNRPKAGTDLGGIRVLTVIDTLTAPAAGSAKVRFFNLSPDVTGVASSTTAAAVSARLINSAGASVATFANRAYRTASGTTLRYTTVPAGTYTAQVYAATSVPSALTATPATSTTVTLGDGKIHTLYSLGLLRKGTLTVGNVQHN